MGFCFKNLETVSQVDFDKIASAFAEESSFEQSVLLREMFDALEHHCKNRAKYQSQLHWIATEIKRKNFDDLIYTINTLNEFLKESE